MWHTIPLNVWDMGLSAAWHGQGKSEVKVLSSKVIPQSGTREVTGLCHSPTPGWPECKGHLTALVLHHKDTQKAAECGGQC